MKTVYQIFLTALSVLILSWFLPWIYGLLFPVAVNDPFVAYSPLTDTFIVSESGGGDIYAVDAQGRPVGEILSKEDRDSLLPHIYYTQLMAHDRMPDSVAGREVSVPIFKQSQWVFSSSPRDLNKVVAGVNLMMESMPPRVDLEDPEMVFRIKPGKVEFIDIADNRVNAERSRRFTEIFADRGFAYPAKTLSANVTTRKPYDEGYLIADNNGDIFHVKMQAGRPYMVKVAKSDSVVAEHLFILENVDRRQLGLVSDTARRFYVLERDGYRLIPLEVGEVDPERDRLSVVKNLFNWVVKISTPEGSRWVALDSENYAPLATYSVSYPASGAEVAVGYIFPFELSFTDVTDCVARPRLDFFSWHVVFLNVVLALILLWVYRRQRASLMMAASGVTLICGIFSFIPFIIFRNIYS